MTSKNNYDLNNLIKRNTPSKTLKMNVVKNGGFYYTRRFCPNCKTDLIKNEKQNYCYHCGQRLDWQDDKEGKNEIVLGNE